MNDVIFGIDPKQVNAMRQFPIGPFLVIVLGLSLVMAKCVDGLAGDGQASPAGSLQPTPAVAVLPETPVHCEVKPWPSLNFPVRFEQPIDGDTIRVTAEITFDLRLKDCWAHETRLGSDTGPKEKALGLAAKAYMQKVIAGKRGLASIDLSEAVKFSDIQNQGRIIGHAWPEGEELPLSARMIQAGHARATKAELLGQ